MAELFKFRCPGCSKLLGISSRKVGREIRCPRCGAELIVPSPDDDAAAGAAEGEDAEDLADLGIDLGFPSPLDIRLPDRLRTATADPPDATEALDYLDRMAESGIPNIVADPFGADATGSDDDADAEPLVATPLEPLTRRDRATRARAATFDRRRDVVLPRTAAIAWALFALMALAFSFVAGLLLGHYRWPR